MIFCGFEKKHVAGKTKTMKERKNGGKKRRKERNKKQRKQKNSGGFPNKPTKKILVGNCGLRRAER